jgi:hypothetical protein
MSTPTSRIALSLAAFPLLLGLGIAHAAPPATTPTAAATADEEDAGEQKTRRDAYIKRAFERFDTNKDGKIDADEFRVGLERRLDRQKAVFDSDFNDADSNHDGKLSRAEVRKANPTLYQNFSDVDANNDGFLTKSEIRASIREKQMQVTVEGDTGEQQDGAGSTPSGK